MTPRQTSGVRDAPKFSVGRAPQVSKRLATLPRSPLTFACSLINILSPFFSLAALRERGLSLSLAFSMCLYIDLHPSPDPNLDIMSVCHNVTSSQHISMKYSHPYNHRLEGQPHTSSALLLAGGRHPIRGHAGGALLVAGGRQIAVIGEVYLRKQSKLQKKRGKRRKKK